MSQYLVPLEARWYQTKYYYYFIWQMKLEPLASFMNIYQVKGWLKH